MRNTARSRQSHRRLRWLISRHRRLPAVSFHRRRKLIDDDTRVAAIFISRRYYNDMLAPGATPSPAYPWHARRIFVALRLAASFLLVYHGFGNTL